MSVFIKLTTMLGALQANATVSNLMRSVKQDPQLEKIDYSAGPVLKAAGEMTDQEVKLSRIAIMHFLNGLMYATRTGKSIPEEGWVWLWENHTRLTKLLCVSMTLESANLKSFGATPDHTDVPQALLWIPELISRGKNDQFERLRVQHTDRFKRVAENPSFGVPYLKLYTDDISPPAEYLPIKIVDENRVIARTVVSVKERTGKDIIKSLLETMSSSHFPEGDRRFALRGDKHHLNDWQFDYNEQRYVIEVQQLPCHLKC